MLNENLIKLRFFALTSLLILFYPIVFPFTILIKLYQTFVKSSKCKSIVGEVAVITGAANGLGKEIAIELAKEGANMAIVDINLEQAQETAAFLSAKYNIKAKAYKVDVSDYEAVQKFNENVTQDLGETTILINNAGVLLCSNRLKPHHQDIQRMINVNYTSHFWTNSIFLPKMKQLKRGHIVAISSIASLFPLIYNGTYSSTKCAVRGLMAALRLELKFEGHKNIHATTVCPSFLQTNKEVVQLCQKSGFDLMYPMIGGEEAAKRIVRGMLLQEQEIFMPVMLRILYVLLQSLPAAWQDFILAPPQLTTHIKSTLNKDA